MTNKSIKISLAAVPYFWTQQNYWDFYQPVAESAVDIVYLGETVCSKRRQMGLEDWLSVAKLLSDAGKQVVLSSLTLIEASSELMVLKKIVKQQDYLIEANDIAAIELANRYARDFVAGSPINLYNLTALKYLIDQGMTRWVVPVELGSEEIKPLIPFLKKQNVDLEYQVFGRMALAHSARCFTARQHGLEKDHCEFKCLDDPQGLLIKTQEGQSFAQINGIQTQSAKLTNLIDQLQTMTRFGIDIIRIVPVSPEDTLAVIEHINQVIQLNQNQSLPEFEQQYEFCNGYWFQIEGIKQVVQN